MPSDAPKGALLGSDAASFMVQEVPCVHKSMCDLAGG